jgi:hypothetical protein
MREIRKSGSVRDIEIPHMVEYCGTLDTERQEEQRKQIRPKRRNYIMSTRQKVPDTNGGCLSGIAGSPLGPCYG